MEDCHYIVQILRGSIDNQLTRIKEEEAPPGKGMAE
jgi:hypothetical protein